MKDLHLFAIGNALVDVQLTITEEQFAELGLKKGGMMLVSAEQQEAYLQKFSDIHRHVSSGGSAANTIIGFAQFGGKAAYGTRLGNDDFGKFYAEEFQSLGIELYAEKMSGANTGTCLIFITPDAERTLNTALAANTTFSGDHISEEAIKRAEWLYIEGYKFSEDSGTEAIEKAIYFAKKHDTKIAITFSDGFIVQFFGEQLRKAVAQADLIFCNEAEAQAFSGANSNDDAFEFLRHAVPNVAMTMSERGSRLWIDGKRYDVFAAEATPKDATGAGDMYAAGFLYGITHGFAPAESGTIGSVFAAKVISQFGARLGHNHFEEFRASNGKNLLSL